MYRFSTLPAFERTIRHFPSLFYGTLISEWKYQSAGPLRFHKIPSNHFMFGCRSFGEMKSRMMANDSMNKNVVYTYEYLHDIGYQR